MLRPFTFVVVSVATVLLSATAPPPLPSRKLGPMQKIDLWGYALRVPEDWISIPGQPGETRVVGGWQPDPDQIVKRYDRASVGCSLQVVRYPVKGVTSGPRTEEEKKKQEQQERLRKIALSPETARDIGEYIESRWKGASQRYTPQKISAGRGSSRLEGDLAEFTSGNSYVCGAVYRKDNFEWGVFYEAPEQFYEREWKRCYMQSLQTFQLFAPSGEGPVVIDPNVDKSELSETQRREMIKANIAGNPGWWSLDTDHYVFLTNSRQRGFIQDLAKEIEVIRSEVYEKLFPPAEEVKAISIVRVFGDESEYYSYGGPYGSAGYWSSDKEELVLFDNFSEMGQARSREYTKAVMHHEAFHQYIYYAVGDIAPHSWFNEGHGDYFAGMVVRGNHVSVRPFEWRTEYLDRKMGMGENLIPVRSLVRLPQSEYYSNAGLKYSEGWALIYFLRNVTKNSLWQGIPDRYFGYLRDNIGVFKKLKEKEDKGDESIPGIPGVKVIEWEDRQKVEQILNEAVDKGFEGVDYDELDRAFEAWVKSIT